MNDRRRRQFALRNTPVMLKLKKDCKQAHANLEAFRKRELKLAEKRRSRAPKKKTLRLAKQQEDLQLNARAETEFNEKIR